jgi:ribose transport system permease protein
MPVDAGGAGDVSTAHASERRERSRTTKVGSILDRIALPIVWILLIIVFGALKPSSFLTTGNMSAILGSQGVLVVLALALIIPLRAGDYDLSIGGTLTLSSMMIGVMNANMHISILVAILCALLAGILIGLFNAGVSLYFGINPFITTLGMGTLLLGIVLLISNDQTIAGISPGLVSVVIIDQFLHIPLVFYYVLILALVLFYIFDFTALGRRLLFVGSGRDVARLSGVKVGRVRAGALVASGFLAALAGVLYAGTSGAANPSSGANLLLPAFAAAYLGATTIIPGRFNPWGTVLASYFLVTGVTGLAILGINSWVQDVFYGGALIVAVALSQLARRRQVQELG